MKKLILLTIPLLMKVSFAFCQTPTPDPNPLFAVIKDEKLGFIDQKGNLVIQPQFENVSESDLHEFKEDMCAVKKYGSWGFINKSGTLVVPSIYKSVNDFENGKARVTKKKSTDHKDDLLLFGNEMTGYIDKSGNELMPVKFKTPIMGGYLSEGLMSAENDDKTGFVNEKGEVAIDYQFYYANSFSDGLAAVKKEKEGKYFFINKKGEKAFDGEWSSANSFKDGVAIVYKNKDDKIWSLIDKNGKYIAEDISYKPQGFFGANYSEGLLLVKDGNNKYGFMDKTGKLAIPCKYDYHNYGFYNGLASVNSGGTVKKDGWFDKCTGGQWGFIDNKGNTVVPFGDYDEVSGFSEGLAPVKKNDKWGFINKSGKMIIEPQFGERPGGFKNGLSRIIGPGTYSFSAVKPIGYINKEGKTVWETQK